MIDDGTSIFEKENRFFLIISIITMIIPIMGLVLNLIGE